MVIPLAFSCKKKPVGEIPQGIIEYKIIYLQEEIGNFSTGVLPQTMEVVYKGDKVKNTIEGALGFFHLINIADLDKMTNTTYLKFIDKKYMYKGKKSEKPCCFGQFEDMKITITDESKEILGLDCTKAVASFKNSDIRSFPLYFSTEIGVPDPNATSPFKDIPGVLMEFQTKLGNSDILMIAQKYERTFVNDKEFNHPQNYRIVNRTEMETIFNALLK
jgi:GLPGLI family protein